MITLSLILLFTLFYSCLGYSIKSVDTIPKNSTQELLLKKYKPSFIIYFNSILSWKSVYSRIPPWWHIEENVNALSNYFFQDFDNPFASEKMANGQTAMMRINGKYYRKGYAKKELLVFSSKFKIIYQYPSNLLSQPVNDEHRLQKQNKYYTLDSLLVKYKNNRLTASIFLGVGHTDWKDFGDLFGLFPEQYDVYNYKRVGGRRVPRGGEIIYDSKFGNFHVILGPEIFWGGGASVLTKWNYKSRNLLSSVIFKDEKILWGQKDEHLRELELFLRTRPSKLSCLSVAILYRPFRMGWPYTYVKKVQLGEGSFGSKFRINESRTRRLDAFGAIIKFEKSRLLFISKLYTTFSYCGLLAGNKYEISFGLAKVYNKYLNILGEFTFRNPVIGPNSLIYEGSIEKPGPILFGPRGPDDPFWVNSKNRKAKILSLSFLFDPTPATRFFKYQNVVLDEWNLSPTENSSFAFVLNYKACHFPTSTDLQTYVDQFGNIIWEPPLITGMWPTKKPIHFIELLCRLGFSKKKYDYVTINLKIGNSLATSGLAYGRQNFREKPITTLFDIAFLGKWKKVGFGLKYGRNIWGPEDWHRRFGATIDRRYKIDLHIQTNQNSNLKLCYLRYREHDNLYLAYELGPFDELMVSYQYNFSRNIGIF